MQHRRIAKNIEEDLHKMVLIAGPRQSGKTTIAKSLQAKYQGIYYNWDDDQDRMLIMKSQLDFDTSLWIFDELHKYRQWRSWLKSKYDKNGSDKKIIVTGSAKLDVYSRGGDSMQGRYFLHRLHPFTYSELLNISIDDDFERIPLMTNIAHDFDSLRSLLELGGFPEPLLKGSARHAKRWRNSYGARLVREDIRDLENLIHLDKVELLYNHLPNVVASPLSINSLREDLEVSFETVRNWINIFEKTYACFRLSPLGGNRLLKNIKAVKKEQKLYFWDWAMVDDAAARYENLLAFHLLRLSHWLEDIYGEKNELRYYRDVRGREVDFILTKNSKPWIAVEAKLSEQSLDPNLRYLLERVKIPYAFQVHLNGSKQWQVEDINGCKVFILPATKFLANLP